jgi:hypothetical protein
MNQQRIYLLIAVPGTGKTWVANQVKDKFNYVPHDDYQSGGYVKAIAHKAINGDKPVLCETPFSISNIMGPLERSGLKVTPVFILESITVTADRYYKRTGNPIIKGHITRIETYKQRAKELSAKSGTAQEILEYLKGL